MANGLYRFWFSNPTADYFPLKSSLQWLLYHVWGTNPAAFHITNILLHAVDSVLVWLVLSRVF